MEQELKRPNVCLYVAPDHRNRDDIEHRRITATVRNGHRDYREGENAMLCCHLVPWALLVRICGTRHSVLRELTPEECNAAGFRDHTDVIEELRQYYPLITLDTPVTFIRWNEIYGALAKA